MSERLLGQLGLFEMDPVPAAQPPVKGASLERMTWADEVDMGDWQTPASELPAWKLSFRENQKLLLRAARPDARQVMARVIHSSEVPADFTLPVLVQVEVSLEGSGVVATTMIPASAVERHLLTE